MCVTGGADWTGAVVVVTGARVVWTGLVVAAVVGELTGARVVCGRV